MTADATQAVGSPTPNQAAVGVNITGEPDQDPDTAPVEPESEPDTDDEADTDD